MLLWEKMCRKPNKITGWHLHAVILLSRFCHTGRFEEIKVDSFTQTQDIDRYYCSSLNKTEISP